jgi:ABC-type dipeptide/oligopeptide/nickel transport system permease subunit
MKGAVAALIRACVVFFGGTAAGHVLLSSSNGFSGLATEFSGFWPALGDALSLSTAVSTALGNTMYLAAPAILIGAITGFAFSALLRFSPVRTILGPLTPLIVALLTPGILLFPLAWNLTSSAAIPTGPLGDDASFGDSAGFIAVWSGIAGLALAAPLGVWIARRYNDSGFGFSPAIEARGARTEAAREWRIGVPTTAFIVALAASEVMSGHAGLFSLFRDSLAQADLTTAFSIVVIMVTVAAVLAALVDVAGAMSRRQRSGEAGGASVPNTTTVVGSVRTSRLTALPFLALAGIVLLAGAGYGTDTSAIAADQTPRLDPAIGGPWLGTDALGRSLLTVIADGTGPTLVFSLVVAAGAMVLGTLVALIRRAGSAVDWLIGILIDGLWWPTVLFLPLISIAAGAPERPEASLPLLALSAAAMTPMASRVIGRTVLPARTSRLIRLLSTWLFISAVVVSIQVVAALLGLLGSGEHGNLGQLIAQGLADYEQQPLLLVAPAVTAALIMATLYYLGSAIAVPVAEVVPVVDATENIIIGAAPEDATASSTPIAGAEGAPDLYRLEPNTSLGGDPIHERAAELPTPDPALPEPAEVDPVPHPPGWGPVVLEPVPGTSGADPVAAAETTESWSEPTPPAPPTIPTTPRRSAMEQSPTNPGDDTVAAGPDEAERSSDAVIDLTTPTYDSDTAADAGIDLNAVASQTVELRPSTVRLALAQAAEATRQRETDDPVAPETAAEVETEAPAENADGEDIT